MRNARPLLICLDLERGFADPDSEHFIPNVERPLRACELVLDYARKEHWRIAHCFRHASSNACDSRPIRGFEPIAGEMLFRRSALSPYAVEAFSREMDDTADVPAFLVGFASARQILATILDSVSRRHNVSAILEAIHTPSAPGVAADALNDAAKIVLQGLNSGFSAEEAQIKRQLGVVRMLIGATP